MKLQRFLPSFVILALACGVTVGSLYVTVKAANSPAEETDVPATVVSESAVLETIDVRHDRSHTIVLDKDGGFGGRLSSLSRPIGELIPAPELTVRIVRHGNVIKEVSTTAEGTFHVTGMTAGVVGVVAYGESGLFIAAVRLVEATEETIPVALNVLDLSMDAAIISDTDVDLARELILANAPSGARRFQGELAEGEDEFPFGEGAAATSLAHTRVRLGQDGALRGHINLHDPRTGQLRMIRDLTMHFIRDGKHVVDVDVEPSGDFATIGLLPGIYSLVTTGEDGILAMGIDIVGSTSTASISEGTYQLAGIVDELELCVSPINAENLNKQNMGEMTEGQLNSVVETPVVEGAAMPDGIVPPGGFAGGFQPAGSGGGGFGGGGAGAGGGGGGALGALALGGIGAAVGYAVGDNNNNAASPAQ